MRFDGSRLIRQKRCAVTSSKNVAKTMVDNFRPGRYLLRSRRMDVTAGNSLSDRVEGFDAVAFLLRCRFLRCGILRCGAPRWPSPDSSSLSCPARFAARASGDHLF